MHTGTPLVTDEGYVGDDVHVAARVAAVGHGGQIVLSEYTRRLVDGFALTDLGEHRLKDIDGPVAIFQLGESSFPPLKTISNTNLPRPASSFVGREGEISEVRSRIEGGARLVTLTGPGGSGKTRLAIEAATALVAEYKAGVFWIGLASLRDPALVTETISQTLGAKDGLAGHIGEREMLLLLDNLEQVIEAAPELSALVSACPNLTLLVTSRELLRVQGEVEYPVPPLAKPEAVSLFSERAQLAPSEEIAELCARLDNLPLAVELAAARAKALSPAQILNRLSERLDLLRGGRDAEARHETLRATIAWSYDLLPEDEQRLFARLAVFAGGCRLDAAEEVAGADLDTLQSLVEKSLLRYSDERYWMLETVREYAADRLGEEHDSLMRRHGAHFLRVAEGLGLSVESYEVGIPANYAVAGLEQDNFRVAIDRSHTTHSDLGLRLATALEQFWVAHSAYEGARVFETLLGDSPDVPPEVRARALRCLGGMRTVSGDSRGALPLYEASLALYEKIGDEWGIVHMRHRLATTALAHGDWSACRSILEENLVRARTLGSRYLEGEALSVLGIVEDHDGNVELAIDLIGQSLAIARAVGFRWREAVDLVNLADMSLTAGRLDDAAAHARASLELSRVMDDRLSTVVSLASLALVAHAHRDARHAGFLWGAIEAEEARSPLGRWGQSRDDYETTLSELAGAEFELGRREGRAQSLERAVAFALASLD
jgi:predicted ATPase